eukprot:10908219-Alexandrium_andersonii.AAC.1
MDVCLHGANASAQGARATSVWPVRSGTDRSGHRWPVAVAPMHTSTFATSAHRSTPNQFTGPLWT